MSATTIETLKERGFVPVLRVGNLTLWADWKADKSVITELTHVDGWIGDVAVKYGKTVVHSPRSRQFAFLHRCLLENGETV